MKLANIESKARPMRSADAGPRPRRRDDRPRGDDAFAALLAAPEPQIGDEATPMSLEGGLSPAESEETTLAQQRTRPQAANAESATSPGAGTAPGEPSRAATAQAIRTSLVDNATALETEGATEVDVTATRSTASRTSAETTSRIANASNARARADSSTPMRIPQQPSAGLGSLAQSATKPLPPVLGPTRIDTATQVLAGPLPNAGVDTSTPPSTQLMAHAEDIPLADTAAAAATLPDLEPSMKRSAASASPTPTSAHSDSKADSPRLGEPASSASASTPRPRVAAADVQATSPSASQPTAMSAPTNAAGAASQAIAAAVTTQVPLADDSTRREWSEAFADRVAASLDFASRGTTGTLNAPPGVSAPRAASPFAETLARPQVLRSEVIADVRMQAGDGGEGTAVQIDHPQFGRIQLQLRMQAGLLEVRAMTHDLGASMAIRASEALLRERVARRGLSLGSIRVSTQDKRKHRRVTRARGLDMEA